MRFGYRMMQLFVWVLFRLVYRISATGLENIPERGGVIIASNHASYADPPCIGCIIGREMSFFAKKELFKIPVFSSIIRYTNSIPVDRQGFSRGALKEIIDRLKGGWAVLIFPEGTRTKTGTFLEPKSGAGMAAVMADVPIVPCWVEGSFRAKLFRSKITLHFLPPFKPSEVLAETKKDHYLLVSKKIMCDIINLYETRTALREKAESSTI